VSDFRKVLSKQIHKIRKLEREREHKDSNLDMVHADAELKPPPPDCICADHDYQNDCYDDGES